MQSSETDILEQQAPEEASATVAEAAPKKRGRPAGSKNKKKTSKKKASKKKAGKKKASKKKTSKKKTTKKKATKKKASKKRGKKKASKKVAATPGSKKKTSKKAGKKKASKKKSGKKKRGKKKASAKPASSNSMARLMAAVEELREAVVEFAHSKTEDQQAVVAELRRSAQAKIADLEDAAVRSLKKLGL